MKVVVIGLSITSSWANGHAANYRGLVRELAARGHQVLFCEHDTPWHESTRALRELRGARLCLYTSLDELAQLAGEQIAEAELVIVGSHVLDGATVAEYVLATTAGRTAFYDIDTPETLAKLDAGEHEYLTPALVPRFDLYLSSAGGLTLSALEQHGARHAVPFYPLVDPRGHVAVASRPCWDLGYLGSYSAERQPRLEALLLTPARALRARRFVVAGPQYPEDIAWPANVARIQHIASGRRPVFYGAQRFTLNLARGGARDAGWSPDVALFEAAACGTTMITDYWPGLEDFFAPEKEIIVARSADEVLRALIETGIETRLALAARARQRVLREHTAARRIDQLERELHELPDQPSAVLGELQSAPPL
ncbi:MAG: glycosyltransferase [Acidobacteriota bacterium]|nr:glycosyltransferase [Acidobacteriota bacterium]